MTGIKSKLRKFLKSPYLTSLFVITMLGAFLRFLALGDASFWLDEAWHTWAAKNFLNGKGFADGMNAIGTYDRGLVTTTIPIALSFYILGTSEFAARLPSAIIGIGTILLSYKLGKEILNKRMGLLVASLMSIDQLALTWSREARFYIHFQFLFIIGVLLLLRWSRSGFELKNKNFFGIVLTGILGLLTHRGFLAFFAVAAAHILFEKLNSCEVKNLKEILFTVGGLSLIGMLLIQVFGEPTEYLILLGKVAPWYNNDRGTYFYFNFLKNNYYSLFTLMWIGSILLLKNVFKRPKHLLPLLAFWIPIVTHTFLIKMKSPRYIFYLLPFFIIIAAYPLWKSIEILNNRFSLKEIHNIVIIVLIALVLINNVNSSFSFLEKNSHGMIENRADYQEIEKVLDQKVSKDDIVIATTPNLLSWYWGKKPEYSMSAVRFKNKSGKLYDFRAEIPAINSKRQLEKLRYNKTIYIVADKRFNWYLPSSLQNYVKSESNKILSQKNLKIYKIDRLTN